jgi:hypothetical protein
MTYNHYWARQTLRKSISKQEKTFSSSDEPTNSPNPENDSYLQLHESMVASAILAEANEAFNYYRGIHQNVKTNES